MSYALTLVEVSIVDALEMKKIDGALLRVPYHVHGICQLCHCSFGARVQSTIVRFHL